MTVERSNGTTVVHRKTEYKPPFSLSTLLIGRPLPTADAPHQTIGKAIGLAVFASDALSSTAYATEEMMFILVAAGSGALSYSIPISFAIVFLLAILTASYEQTIHAYPNGGGAYIVTRDNLGTFPALGAAAALLADYILTVSVSISSGVAQIVSAFPALYHYRVEIALGFIVFIMLVNLRGVKESGILFSIPTYFFVVMMFITVIIGLIRYFTNSLGVVVDPPHNEMAELVQPLTFFLILRAFSNGTSAVTGVEAISDGITAFKEPRSRNAGITLILMSFILGSLLLGITFLAYHIQVMPAESETVISQLARTVYNSRGFLYMGVIVATTVILVMAANTALFENLLSLTMNASLDPYTIRTRTDENGRKTERRINEYAWKSGQWGRITSASIAMSTNLNPKGRKNDQHTRDKIVNSNLKEEEKQYLLNNPDTYIDFDIPWRLSMNYSLSFSHGLNAPATITQALQFSGDVSLSKQWKVVFNSGYDFKAKALTMTNLGISRDLHCWSLTFNWTPFGTFTQFHLRINAKASMLQDLRLERRKPFYDNR